MTQERNKHRHENYSTTLRSRLAETVCHPERLCVSLDTVLQSRGLACQKRGHLWMGSSPRGFYGNLDDAAGLPHLRRKHLLCHEQGRRGYVLQRQSPAPACPTARGDVH